MFRSLFDIVERQRVLIIEDDVITSKQRNVEVQVDPVNGDDSNDGRNAPFKTLRRAINEILVGGIGEIELLNDVVIDENLLIDNKAILILGNGHKITVKSYAENGSNFYYGFHLRKASLAFDYVTIQLEGKADSSVGWNCATSAFLKGNHPAGPNFVRVNGTIIMPSDAGTFCSVGIGCGAIITHLLFESATIIRDGGTIYEIQGTNGIGSLSVFNTRVKNSSGNAINWKDVVAGIVKTSDGVPRNIVSNIIF